jgi:hypothetical protein
VKDGQGRPGRVLGDQGSHGVGQGVRVQGRGDGGGRAFVCGMDATAELVDEHEEDCV